MKERAKYVYEVQAPDQELQIKVFNGGDAHDGFGVNSTHMHLGLSVVHEAFPQAEVAALPQVADLVNRAYAFKIGYWGRTVLGMNGSKTAVAVAGLPESSILLEGQRLEILGPFRGDAYLCTTVWIPSIKTLVATDTVFNQAHVWVAGLQTAIRLRPAALAV